MNNSPIGIFDSGIGGITILNYIKSTLIKIKYSFYCNGSPKSLNMILNNKFAINTI